MIKKRIIFNVIATISTSIFLSNVFILSKVSAAAYSKSERIYGKNRYETAVKISQKGWERGANCVILASGEGYADALCAAPLAKINDALNKDGFFVIAGIDNFTKDESGFIRFEQARSSVLWGSS